MACKTCSSLRAVVHSERVPAVECEQITARDNLEAALRNAGGKHLLTPHDPERCRAYEETAQRGTGLIDKLNERDLCGLICSASPPRSSRCTCLQIAELMCRVLNIKPDRVKDYTGKKIGNWWSNFMKLSQDGGGSPLRRRMLDMS